MLKKSAQFTWKKCPLARKKEFFFDLSTVALISDYHTRITCLLLIKVSIDNPQWQFIKCKID